MGKFTAASLFFNCVCRLVGAQQGIFPGQPMNGLGMNALGDANSPIQRSVVGYYPSPPAISPSNVNTGAMPGGYANNNVQPGSRGLFGSLLNFVGLTKTTTTTTQKPPLTALSYSSNASVLLDILENSLNLDSTISTLPNIASNSMDFSTSGSSNFSLVSSPSNSSQVHDPSSGLQSVANADAKQANTNSEQKKINTRGSGYLFDLSFLKMNADEVKREPDGSFLVRIPFIPHP